jgi:hypothetical protein
VDNINQIIEIPDYIWKEAVTLACTQSKFPNTKPENSEEITAVEHICEWWNRLESIKPELRCAGSFQIYIQDESNPNIWSEMSSWNDFELIDLPRASCAKVGTNVIVQFFKYFRLFKINGNHVTSVYVDGEEEKTMEADEAGEAWYSYQGLLEFSPSKT